MAGRSAPRPARSAASWASTIARASANTSFANAGRPITYDRDLRVGVVLPESGVTYYDVPAEYHAPPGYRYTIVNDRPVLIESHSRRIVEIVE